MTISTGYRHGDFPCAVNGVFAKRVQSINLDDAAALRTTSELGHFEVVGQSQDSDTYRGSISWFPIDNQVECLFAGYPAAVANTATGSPVSLAQLVNSGGGIPVHTLKTLFDGCKVTSLEYTATAEGEFRGTVNFEGTSMATGSAINIIPVSGVGAYTGKDVKVEVNGVTGIRMTGITARANIASTTLKELNNANPVGVAQDAPTVTCDIDFVESDAMAANNLLTLTDPKDIVITVGASAKVITLKNMVSGSAKRGDRGNVNGWATRRYSYQSSSESTYYGLVTDIVTHAV